MVQVSGKSGQWRDVASEELVLALASDEPLNLAGLGFLTHKWGCFEDLGSWQKWRAPSLPSAQQCWTPLSNDYEEQERGFDHILSRSLPLIYISTEEAS